MPAPELIFYIVIILFVGYWIHTQQKQPEIKYIYKDVQRQPTNDDEKQINIDIHNEPRRGPPIIVDPLRDYDRRTIEDDLTPPFRRSYYDYDVRGVPGLGPYYSRGRPGLFRKVGTLIAQDVPATDKYKFLLLMGRQKWSGGEYEYYAISPDRDQKLKFFVHSKNKEITNGDTVKLHELDGYTFIFKEDKDLSPLYDPYSE
jgi:hypothetical protein